MTKGAPRRVAGGYLGSVSLRDKTHLKVIRKTGAEEKAQWLSALAVLAEDLSLDPSTHMR